MPLSRIYGTITGIRNRLYDRGVLRSYPLGARTISVGNITAGGTGKTPLVALITEILAAKGEKVCILTRGYGRKHAGCRVLVSDGHSPNLDPEAAGDEPVELARRLGDKAVIVADADRVAAAGWAKTAFGVTTFILDDGFQHRRARRDLDIVCIDATDPFGGGRTLPGGRLRERPTELSRADVIVITRADLVAAAELDSIRSEVSGLAVRARVFTARSRIIRLVEIGEFKAPRRRSGTEYTWSMLVKDHSHEPTMDLQAASFTALGNPKAFFAQLRSAFEKEAGVGMYLTTAKAFPDHHFYTQSDVKEIEKHARASGAAVLLTTAKDAVKLEAMDFSLPCFVVEIETAIDDREAFDALF